MGERVPLSLRVTPEMKRRLDAAAEQSGRSQSQEAELRLERTFDRQGLLFEILALAYGSERIALDLIWLGGSMRLLERGDKEDQEELSTLIRELKNQIPPEFDPDRLRKRLQVAQNILRAISQSVLPSKQGERK